MIREFNSLCSFLLLSLFINKHLLKSYTGSPFLDVKLPYLFGYHSLLVWVADQNNVNSNVHTNG